MSLSDTIDAIIKESTSVERELRWFLSALPAIVSTEPTRPFMRLGRPSTCGRCANASTGPRPLPKLGSGMSTGRVVAGHGAVLGWDVRNQHLI